MVESVACMPQNLRLELIQSLFLVNDGKSAAFVPQNSNGATDRHWMMDRLSYPDLLHSQMGYILTLTLTALKATMAKSTTSSVTRSDTSNKWQKGNSS
jgi:hypothetical protein